MKLRFVMILSLFAVSAICVVSAQAQSDLAGPVKLGVLNDQSGPYVDASGPGSVIAAQMAIEDFGGSVLGKKIELIYADHQLKPDVAVNIARQWSDREGVDAFVDLAGSNVTLAVQEFARKANRIVLNTGPRILRSEWEGLQSHRGAVDIRYLFSHPAMCTLSSKRASIHGFS